MSKIKHEKIAKRKQEIYEEEIIGEAKSSEEIRTRDNKECNVRHMYI